MLWMHFNLQTHKQTFSEEIYILSLQKKCILYLALILCLAWDKFISGEINKERYFLATINYAVLKGKRLVAQLMFAVQ